MLDIQQPDMRIFHSAVCGGAFQFCLQSFQIGRRHSHAIVIDADEKIIVFHPRTDKQCAGASLWFQAVINSIFHQWLKQQFHHWNAESVFTDADQHIQLISKTQLLNGEVSLSDFQFFAQRNHIAALDVVSE